MKNIITRENIEKFYDIAKRNRKKDYQIKRYIYRFCGGIKYVEKMEWQFYKGACLWASRKIDKNEFPNKTKAENIDLV